MMVLVDLGQRWEANDLARSTRPEDLPSEEFDA
jgi:hypothetical protein